MYCPFMQISKWREKRVSSLCNVMSCNAIQVLSICHIMYIRQFSHTFSTFVGFKALALTTEWHLCYHQANSRDCINTKFMNVHYIIIISTLHIYPLVISYHPACCFQLTIVITNLLLMSSIFYRRYKNMYIHCLTLIPSWPISFYSPHLSHQTWRINNVYKWLIK